MSCGRNIMNINDIHETGHEMGGSADMADHLYVVDIVIPWLNFKCV